jgi:hypothetical protein
MGPFEWLLKREFKLRLRSNSPDDKPKLAGDSYKAEVRSVVRPWSSASVSQDVVKQITDINSSEHEDKFLFAMNTDPA